MDAEQKKPVVLLTGANGFLGKRFCKELVSQGYHVIATGTKEQKGQNDPDITYVKVDLTDSKTREPGFWDEFFQKYAIDSVIHNAGIIDEVPKKGQTFENVNVLSTVALADAAAAHHVNKFIFISTIGASHSYAHKYGYPGSKQKAEAYLQGRDDLNWTIVRPDIVYSEKSWGHSFSFDELSGLRVVPVIGDGKQKLQPIHIDDIAQTVNLLSNGKANHETLNACGSEAIEIREILQFLRE
ncbi:MAG: SDR family NAD(P)-dependent oxidoreductase, partial [Alphaproteobacteria bacterium]|nr:SDR family NAD(P)-dependent oxidoreductase [Alphaproteobacteria bacterium]